MSIFNSGANDQDAPVVPETNEAILAQVTEKFKNDKGELDVVALAKGKIESDLFIERLKSEQDRFRQDLNARTSLEELLSDLKNARQPASTPNPQGQPNEIVPEGKNETALTVESIKALLQQELSETQKLARAQRNIDAVERELAKQWGTSTSNKLKLRAQELEMSLEELKSIAASKPKAFLELIGAKAPIGINTQEIAPPSGSMRPEHREQPKGRNYAHYEKLRKENPTEYWSVKVQSQEMADAVKMGEDFYK